jgi:hypothetical protein
MANQHNDLRKLNIVKHQSERALTNWRDTTLMSCLLLTSRPRLNETVFGVLTSSKIHSTALKNKVLYDSDAEFFGITNNEIRNRLALADI